MFGTTAARPISAFGTPTVQDNQDIEVVNPPDDTVTSLHFTPASGASYLLSTSWDGQVRCYEIAGTGQSQLKASQANQGPLFDGCWSPDGTKVFTAAADKFAWMWDLQSNSYNQVAQHDQPVKFCKLVTSPQYTCLVTGSWDKTIKFWDLRSPNPMLSFSLPERVYCADIVYPVAVVCTANRHVMVYSLEGTPTQVKQLQSPLNFQTRCVRVFMDKINRARPTGFAIGSIEGRVGIQYFEPTQPRDNFTFKCHRQAGASNFQEIYAVHDLVFHPQHGTLATVGGDGRYVFWDKDARTKLKNSEQLTQPVTCCNFDPSGSAFTYAIGYDWSRGYEGNDINRKPKIYLHKCGDEVKPSNQLGKK
ncbi:hypothetical protein BOX15_Mlig008585g3 [Macrostomum lignano]|uniref:Uncharacterized protein n=3 Tax=Macrostomum lignano TaxID=282301 RepID=A0A267G2A1_9PLAT|nr:hypothetical protein BOX15_Mlig008585g1 [Macrostomum lignano]PAA80215.1 hypothetical protein BOX15_Mlig008585g3 [Macrostomum lignano]